MLVLLNSAFAVVPIVVPFNCTSTNCVNVPISCNNDTCIAVFIVNGIRFENASVPAALCGSLRWNTTNPMDFTIPGFCSETNVTTGSTMFNISFDGTSWQFRYLIDVATNFLFLETGNPVIQQIHFAHPANPVLSVFCQIVAADKFSAKFTGHGGCIPLSISYTNNLGIFDLTFSTCFGRVFSISIPAGSSFVPQLVVTSDTTINDVKIPAHIPVTTFNNVNINSVTITNLSNTTQTPIQVISGITTSNTDIGLGISLTLGSFTHQISYSDICGTNYQTNVAALFVLNLINVTQSLTVTCLNNLCRSTAVLQNMSTFVKDQFPLCSLFRYPSGVFIFTQTGICSYDQVTNSLNITWNNAPNHWKIMQNSRVAIDFSGLNRINIQTFTYLQDFGLDILAIPDHNFVVNPACFGQDITPANQSLLYNVTTFQCPGGVSSSLIGNLATLSYHSCFGENKTVSFNQADVKPVIVEQGQIFPICQGCTVTINVNLNNLVVNSTNASLFELVSGANRIRALTIVYRTMSEIVLTFNMSVASEGDYTLSLPAFDDCRKVNGSVVTISFIRVQNSVILTPIPPLVENVASFVYDTSSVSKICANVTIANADGTASASSNCSDYLLAKISFPFAASVCFCVNATHFQANLSGAFWVRSNMSAADQLYQIKPAVFGEAASVWYLVFNDTFRSAVEQIQFAKLCSIQQNLLGDPAKHATPISQIVENATKKFWVVDRFDYNVSGSIPITAPSINLTETIFVPRYVCEATCPDQLFSVTASTSGVTGLVLFLQNIQTRQAIALTNSGSRWWLSYQDPVLVSGIYRLRSNYTDNCGVVTTEFDHNVQTEIVRGGGLFITNDLHLFSSVKYLIQPNSYLFSNFAFANTTSVFTAPTNATLFNYVFNHTAAGSTCQITFSVNLTANRFAAAGANCNFAGVDAVLLNQVVDISASITGPGFPGATKSFKLIIDPQPLPAICQVTSSLGCEMPPFQYLAGSSYSYMCNVSHVSTAAQDAAAQIPAAAGSNVIIGRACDAFGQCTAIPSITANAVVAALTVETFDELSYFEKYNTIVSAVGQSQDIKTRFLQLLKVYVTTGTVCGVPICQELLQIVETDAVLRDLLLSSLVSCHKTQSPTGGLSSRWLTELSNVIGRMTSIPGFLNTNATLAWPQANVITVGSLELYLAQLFENAFVFGYGVPTGLNGLIQSNGLHLQVQNFESCGTPLTLGTATVRLLSGGFPGCAVNTSGQSVLVNQVNRTVAVRGLGDSIFVGFSDLNLATIQCQVQPLSYSRLNLRKLTLAAGCKVQQFDGRFGCSCPYNNVGIVVKVLPPVVVKRQQKLEIEVQEETDVGRCQMLTWIIVTLLLLVAIAVVVVARHLYLKWQLHKSFIA